jgi:2-hydroxy-3-oxopropionate reductase
MLSTKAGVDPAKVFDAIKGGLAGSSVMNAKVPMILDGNFKPGFRIERCSSAGICFAAMDDEPHG